MRFKRFNLQPDHTLTIVEMPKNWKPKSVYDFPPKARIISQFRVASFSEACDDLVRCNEYARKHSLREWAVVQFGNDDAS